MVESSSKLEQKEVVVVKEEELNMKTLATYCFDTLIGHLEGQVSE